MAESPDAPVLLLGTAHVIDLAEPLRAVLHGRPLDAVALELDRERADVLFAPKDQRPKGRGGPLVARLWGYLQRRLGEQIGGGDPGEEMKVAAAVAIERRLPLFLIDDPIRYTFARLLQSMPFKERVTLVVGALAGLFIPARVVNREVERYTDRPDDFAEEIRRVSPTVARVLLDERNEHMAERLADLRARGVGRMAVVVGDAHLPGLSAALLSRGLRVESIPFRELRTIRGPSSSSS